MSPEVAREIAEVEGLLSSLGESLSQILARINSLKRSGAPNDIIKNLEKRYLKLLADSMKAKSQKAKGDEASPESKQ